MNVLIIDALRFVNEGLIFCNNRTDQLDQLEYNYWLARKNRPFWKKVTDWVSASFTLVSTDEFSKYGGIQSQQAACNFYRIYLKNWAPVVAYTNERVAVNWPLIEVPVQLEDLFLEWWGSRRGFENLKAFSGR